MRNIGTSPGKEEILVHLLKKKKDWYICGKVRSIGNFPGRCERLAHILEGQDILWKETFSVIFKYYRAQGRRQLIMIGYSK
jgi:hypothetical protein